MALSLTELRSRMAEWRNMRKLHGAQKARIVFLERENRELRERYERDTLDLRQKLETALILIAELDEKIFGRKRGEKKQTDTPSSGSPPQRDRQPRTPDSYHRTVPQEEPTETKELPVTACKHCGGALAKIETVIRYIEDIILPQLRGQITKTLTKLKIERGYCTSCGV